MISVSGHSDVFLNNNVTPDIPAFLLIKDSNPDLRRPEPLGAAARSRSEPLGAAARSATVK